MPRSRGLESRVKRAMLVQTFTEDRDAINFYSVAPDIRGINALLPPGENKNKIGST